MMRLGAFLFLVLMALAAAPPAEAEDASYLIVNPSGRGNQSMASGFLADLSGALSSSWPSGVPAPAWTGRYHVTEADALASIRREKPEFALVSSGFYLAHRESLGLTPLLEPLRMDEGPGVVHLIVKEGAPKLSPSAMRIGGQLAGEPAWALGPVLGLPAGGVPTFIPAARTLEAIRQLQAGDLDGVLLPEAEWNLVKATNKAGALAVAFTSQPLPEGPVVAFGEPSARTRAAMTALLGLDATEAGRKVLTRMTLRGFKPIEPGRHSPFQASFDAARTALEAGK